MMDTKDASPRLKERARKSKSTSEEFMTAKGFSLGEVGIL
jgi:hypothetical protein